MVYARFTYEIEYGSFHSELVEFIETHFQNVESGLQGDSWIWVKDSCERVEIDTFYSMKHEIKASKPDSQLVKKVIEALSEKYDLDILSIPESEPHE